MFRLVKRISDAGLVRKAQAGRRDAFEALVVRYLPLVHGVALAHTGNRTDADDVAQDTFLKAMTRLGELREPSRFGMWIGTIARRCAMDVHRARQRLTQSEAPETSQMPDPARDELFALLREKVEGLDADHREILLLHYYAGYSVREAADHLNITNEAAKKRLQRARTAVGAEVMRALTPDGPAWDRTRSLVLTAVAKAPAVAGSGEAATTVAMAAGGTAAIPFAAKLAAVGGLATVSVVAAVALFQPDKPTQQITPLPTPPAVVVEDTPAADTTASVEAIDPQTEPAIAEQDATDPWAAYPIHAQVHGRVLTPQGTPVANARITAATNIGGDDRRWEAVTDSAGTFSLSEVRAQYLFVIADVVGMFAADSFNMKDEEPETIELTMEPAASLEGLVVDTAGNPVPDAEAFLFSYAQIGGDDATDHFIEPRWSEVQGARSGPDGRIRIAPLWPGKWTLSIMKDGRGNANVRHASTEGPPFKAVMPVASSVNGRLFDEVTGKGIAGVELTLSSGQVTTGKDGSFTFSEITPGSVSFTLEEDESDWVLTGPTQLVIAEGRSVDGVEVAARMGGRVTGRIVDAATGEGVAGASLSIKDEGIRGADGRTDDTGGFIMKGLAAGSYAITAIFHHDYESIRVTWPYADKFDVAFGQTTRLEPVAIGAAAELRGRVSGMKPEDIGNTHVRVLVDGIDSSMLYPPDEDGAFRIPIAKNTEGAVTVFARSDRAESNVVGPINLGTDAAQSIELPLSRVRPYIEGRVIDLTGVAVPFANVTARSSGGDQRPGAGAVADDSGKFRMALEGPGAYTLTAYVQSLISPSNAGVDTDARPAPLAVNVASSVRDVTVVAPGYVGATIEGTVRGAEGIAVSNVAVNATQGSNLLRTEFTTEEGAFTLTGLLPGTPATLTVESGTHGVAEVTVRDPGQSKVDIDLTRRGAVTGQFIGTDGKPLSEFKAILIAVPQQDTVIRLINGGEPWIHDPEGRFRLDTGVRESMYIVAAAPGHGVTLFPVTLKLDGATDVGALRLDSGAVLHGRVVDPEGHPIAQAKAALLVEGDTMSRHTFHTQACNEQGQFEFPMLPSGTYAVGAIAPGTAPVTEQVTVGRNDTAEITLTLQPAASVRIHVLSRGEPVYGHIMKVKLADDGTWPDGFAGSGFDGLRQEDGTVLYDDLTPGYYGFTVSSPNAPRSIRRTLRVEAGESIEIELDPDAGSGRVVGSLVRDGGVEAQTIPVVLTLATTGGEFSMRAEMNADGSVVFENVPAGTGTLALLLHDPATGTRLTDPVTCAVREGAVTEVNLILPD